MKVPLPANNTHISKPVLNCTTDTAPPTTALPPIPTAAATATITTPNSYTYEPKSVLDLRGSQSPVAEKTTSNGTASADILADPLQLEDHVLINNTQLEYWDSNLMSELSPHTDSLAVSKTFPQPNSQPEITQIQHSNLPEYPDISSFDSNQFVASDFGILSEISSCLNSNGVSSFEGFPGDLNSTNWNGGFDNVAELIRLAECLDTSSLQLGHMILARLNQRLRSPSGKPLQRSAFYFKEALQSLLSGLTWPSHKPADSFQIIQTIEAEKTFSSISPVSMFSSFTANQALLEALDGSMHVHIIDFDIGLGARWASFMKELSDKADSGTVLRVSAIVREEYVAESRLIGESSTQYARELNISFDVDFVALRNFEYLSFKAIKFVDGEKVAVLLSPAIFRHIGVRFLNDLRLVSPEVVVHVDSEGQMGFGMPSYRQAVIDGLEFYSTFIESLEAVHFNGGGGGDWMRRIETFVLYPKIMEAVEAAGRRGIAWRDVLGAAGLQQVGMSQLADIQAECLLRRMQVRGFRVVKRQAEMLLCWHDRPLVATSAWRY